MYARAAAYYIRALSKTMFNEPDRMEGHVPSFETLDCFDITDTGSHKYIPADRLSEQLGLPAGGGVYSYVRFSDNSVLLKTCPGRVAYWSGKTEDAPEYPKDPTRKI
jgi:hypothetical protein